MLEKIYSTKFRSKKIEEKSLRGNNPLFIAAQNGHAAVAQLLLDYGAGVNQANDNGCTPLDVASFF